MKTTGLILALILACGLANRLPAQDHATPLAPPSLDNVTWDNDTVAYRDLRGKTVIVLVYATWAKDVNAWAGEVLSQLRTAIQDKPVVVLAINADKQAGAGPAYLREQGFVGPNILPGRDPLMPARLGAKTDLFQYAWIDPEGRLVEIGHAGSHYRNGDQKRYVLSVKLGKATDLGKFEIVDEQLPTKLKGLAWALEVGHCPAEAELKALRRDLTEAEQAALDAAVKRYLQRALAQVRQLVAGDARQQLLGYDQAAQMAAAFKNAAETRQAKELASELIRDAKFGRELAAKRAYERALTQAAKSPANRGTLLQAVARQHRRTYYGELAAQDGNPQAAAERPRSIRAWPELTEAEQDAALQQQRAYVDELRRLVPNCPLRAYETKRFLFFSDLAADTITTKFLPYLDEMYAQLCGAYSLDPDANLWKGKATIVAFQDQARFEQFETAAYGQHNPSAQGLAHCGSDGSVLISCFAGHDLEYFAVVLIHETAHGFAWRYKSGDPLPSWLNEGAAEWIADRVVGGNKSIRRKVDRALQQMRASRSLGGNFFTTDQITDWQYGAAASLTGFLLQSQPATRSVKTAKAPKGKPEQNRYSRLVDGIKAGLPWEDALRETYGVTPVKLVQAYGESIGIPALQP